MKSRKIAVVLVGSAVAACSLLPSAALGQATSQPSTRIHTGLPRNNIRGSQIAAGRPGLWTQSGITAHSKRQQSALRNYGGITISGKEKPSIRDAVLPELVKIIQAAIAAAAAAINAAIAAATGT